MRDDAMARASGVMARASAIGGFRAMRGGAIAGHRLASTSSTDNIMAGWPRLGQGWPRSGQAMARSSQAAVRSGRMRRALASWWLRWLLHAKISTSTSFIGGFGFVLEFGSISSSFLNMRNLRLTTPPAPWINPAFRRDQVFKTLTVRHKPS
jgi:hypothetical protein